MSRLLAACNGTEYFIAGLIAIPLIERVGRRKLMLFSAFGMGMCMAVIAGSSSQLHNMSAIGAAAAFIFLFSLFFPPCTIIEEKCSWSRQPQRGQESSEENL